ncbi:acetyl/propionyl/methylcrotonyl-CoA carboxylase subunit alpha [Thalassotalea sp. ND16A]|uniref:acetyl/propionyl/methylcrotonyl-CoA carboxylase subunit alpha n=1 Tax=Thalassotalea sp. ND16A TaxID=1535422 RepID=UPI00051A16D9|nr:acetyl/propionyl/methylcrotonyl-CoA carboxylase subunit alpha [Thalassotalea sp. ND16A]KGJ93615.1 Methylcrotonoyl-CoA carboxylase [Thalassotalea sp. ND16A]
MFTKILIANRGEIACRVIKTARAMGILTVAVYSDADADSLHVTMADEAVYIGPSPSRESYLLGDKVIAAAIRTGAQAIHPGYGFLSENADFCNKCADSNITFIGPPVPAIEAMGSKSAAKNIMEQANVPLVPGYHGEDQSAAIIKQAADAMGYPVLLKATAGGGGKGMRQVWSEAEFNEALAAAKRESLSSFGDDTMLVEKYLTQPRHVEIQVFCDNHDNAVYLFERDCSVQRRHQKVIEEAPAFGMSEELRKQMGEAAIMSAKAIGYQGAGTVEFLLDVDGSFYFMEMNTRLQVEHPVTEMITGQDLVEWQLRVAAGETLPLSQEQLTINGHAFEARIYAEDPNNDFLPATGKLAFLQPPVESEHVRIDTGVRQGDEVSVFYDPMIAKLIVWDENRDKALQRLSKALMEYRIKGVTTNIDFLYNLATSKPFINEDIDTGFIDKHHDLIFHDDELSLINDLPIAALYLVLAQSSNANMHSNINDPHSPWNASNAWRLNEAHVHSFGIDYNEQTYPVCVEERRQGSAIHYLITIDGNTVDCQGRIDANTLFTNINGYMSKAMIGGNNGQFSLFKQDGVIHFNRTEIDLGEQNTDSSAGGLNAPMNGTMVTLLVELNEMVEKDQPLLIMEAMKMEHTIRAPAHGKVTEFYFNAGDMVDGGAELLAFAAETGTATSDEAES